jgi:hypothetical protein
MTRWTRHLALPFALTLGLAVAGCGDDDDGNGGAGDAELITQVTIALTPAGGGTTQTATITDADGLGPNPPAAQDAPLLLAPGVTYTGTVTFTNSTTEPPTDITQEVLLEADEHRVFYTTSGATPVTVSVTDTDDAGAPLGLEFEVEVGAAAAGDGALRVVLSHYDESPKGDGSTPSTETDVDVTFDYGVNPVD